MELAKPKHIYNELASKDDLEFSLRPRRLAEFIGQSELKNNLSVFINAAKARNEALDHVLFYGPPGLGKTTLSQIIANELEVSIKVSSGPVLSKTGDLAAILTNLEERDVLFIDEIHRLPVSVEEILYTAMEDYSLDLVIGEGPAARAVKITLPKFTLIGATTRLGLLTGPLRDRFGIPLKLDFYNVKELTLVVKRYADLLKVNINDKASELLAKCSRGTPRVAVRLLKRIRDFAQYQEIELVDQDMVVKTLASLEIDMYGLDKLDRKYLDFIQANYKGGPVGVETIAAALSEDKDTLEDTIEPYLIQIGFLSRTSRGRMLTKKCTDYLTS